MKKLMLVCALACTMLFGFAQKHSIAVNPFTHGSSVEDSHATAVRNQMISGLNKAGRIDVLDGATDAKAVADYVLDGEVVSGAITTEEKDGKTKYGAALSFSFRLADQDGNIVATKNMKLSSSAIYDSKTEAVSQAIGSLTANKVKKFVDENIISHGTIVELDEAKGNEVKKLYIDLGSDAGIKKGQKFEVFVEKKVAGRTVLNKIGELKAENIEAGDLTLCKVTKGGKEIMSAVNEGKAVTIKTAAGGGSFLDKMNNALDSVNETLDGI